MEIWNSRSLDNNQRFIAAIAAGLASAIVLGLAYALFVQTFHFTSSILYVLIGWCIGYVIRNVGRGVHKRFGILGAIMTFLAIFIGDCVSYVGIANIGMLFTQPAIWNSLFETWIRANFSTDINSLLGLLLKGIGIYMAYYYSVIL